MNHIAAVALKPEKSKGKNCNVHNRRRVCVYRLNFFFYNHCQSLSKANTAYCLGCPSPLTELLLKHIVLFVYLMLFLQRFLPFVFSLYFTF